MPEVPAAKKSLGQHWLNDAAALASICEAGNVTQDDTVLEIGPGTGTLTELLVRRAKQVVAVEFDERLAAQLARRVPAANLEVVHQDILRFDLGRLPADYKVVANIPYYLTSNLIRKLSETPNQAARIVMLIQKEVAQRVAAGPGRMSLLSVSAQLYWQVSLGPVIPARLFVPPPKVDSQVLILQRPGELMFGAEDRTQLLQLAKAGFASRRKTLLNSLAGGLRIEKEQIRRILIKAGIQPSRRAQTLSLNEWHLLAKTLDSELSHESPAPSK